MAWLGRGPMTVNEARHHLREFEAHFDAYDFGLWAVERRHDGALIGFCGLRRVLSSLYPMAPCVEIAWRQARFAWGHGYMSESALAALEDGFRRVRLNKVFAWTAKANLRSQQVMQRAGMQRAASLDFNHPMLADGHPLRRHVVYLIKRQHCVRSTSCVHRPL